MVFLPSNGNPKTEVLTCDGCGMVLVSCGGGVPMRFCCSFQSQLIWHSAVGAFLTAHAGNFLRTWSTFQHSYITGPCYSFLPIIVIYIDRFIFLQNDVFCNEKQLLKYIDKIILLKDLDSLIVSPRPLPCFFFSEWLLNIQWLPTPSSSILRVWTDFKEEGSSLFLNFYSSISFLFFSRTLYINHSFPPSPFTVLLPPYLVDNFWAWKDLALWSRPLDLPSVSGHQGRRGEILALEETKSKLQNPCSVGNVDKVLLLWIWFLANSDSTSCQLCLIGSSAFWSV